MMFKSIKIILLITYFLGATCTWANDSPNTTPQTLKEDRKVTENNKTIIREFMEEVWNKGNLDAVDKFIAFPYVIHSDPGDQWEGQSLDLPTFKKRVLYSRQAFPDLHFAVKEIIGEGDKVVISWDLEGTHRGDIPGLPATGKRVKAPGLTIYYFSGGKITGHSQVIDRLGFMQQVMPKARQK